MSGGAEANKSGESWEAFVRAVATQQGFEIRHHRERARYDVPQAQRRVVWTHAPYKTIFHNIKNPSKTSTEYVVESGIDLARIECKWQGTAGSVDEKYPFVFLNAAITMEEPTVVLALGGEYFEEGRGKDIRAWLRKAMEEEPPTWLAENIRESMKKRELRVLTPNNFAKWFRERFPKNV